MPREDEGFSNGIQLETELSSELWSSELWSSELPTFSDKEHEDGVFNAWVVVLFFEPCSSGTHEMGKNAAAGKANYAPCSR